MYYILIAIFAAILIGMIFDVKLSIRFLSKEERKREGFLIINGKRWL